MYNKLVGAFNSMATQKTGKGDELKLDVNHEATEKTKEEIEVVYHFRDIKEELVDAWKSEFDKDHIGDRVKISKGDIFKGGPGVDAIVSPANSFGFMDGGIDAAYSKHFGWELQSRLQEVIRTEHDGELLVGNVIIIPIFDSKAKSKAMTWSGYNEDKPIKYLISAPTMRVPHKVDKTVNSYLAFRGVILGVKRHNAVKENEPIRSVLCPGLGTAVGYMPSFRCAHQMLKAYERFYLGIDTESLKSDMLMTPFSDHLEMMKYTDPKKDDTNLKKDETPKQGKE